MTAAREVTGGSEDTGSASDAQRAGGHGRLAPRAEAAVLVGLPLTRHLGLVGGPVLAKNSNGVDATLMAGLRYGF